VLAPELPQKLRDLVAAGSAAIGQVGHNVPDARVIPVEADGFVVEFTSGMMDFQYAVGRALAPIYHEGGQSRGSPDDYDRVVSPLEKLLRQWARYMRWYWVWPWRRIKIGGPPIPQDVREWIEMMATMGELFLLAHELGHIALDIKLVPRVSDKNEVDADRYGLEFLIPALQKYWHKRVAYAAPIIPIRIFASLERLGVQFSEEYPPQADRVRLLREQILKMCPSKHYFYEVTTIMVWWQDMLDDLENHIDPKSPRALPDAERVLVRLIAQLEEVARGNVTLERFIEDIGLLAKANSAETMRRAGGLLVYYYFQNPPLPGAFLSEPLRLMMGDKIAELVPRLPPHLQSLFPPPGVVVPD
jgi:hypothetical protein